MNLTMAYNIFVRPVWQSVATCRTDGTEKHCSNIVARRNLRTLRASRASNNVAAISSAVDSWRQPLVDPFCQYHSVANSQAMVALGKFDALHKGHRALVVSAARLGGLPFLLSFSGMADVLGWPHRLPLVPACDRERVLHSWADDCRGYTPRERSIPFSEVRSLSPEAFVKLLAEDMHVAGVVVGSNYRFGYKAAGNAALLQELGTQYGMQVKVLDLVGTDGRTLSQAWQQQQQQIEGLHGHHTVSSSQVRHALALGDMEQVAACLGRPYRLAVRMSGAESINRKVVAPGAVSKAAKLEADVYLNQPPGKGSYRVAVSLCSSGNSTLDCGRSSDWQEATVSFDDDHSMVLTDFTLQAMNGVVVMDFISGNQDSENLVFANPLHGCSLAFHF